MMSEEAYEGEVEDLKRQDWLDRKYGLLRHPDCRDPDHPGCPFCEDEEDEDDE